MNAFRGTEQDFMKYGATGTSLPLDFFGGITTPPCHPHHPVQGSSSSNSSKSSWNSHGGIQFETINFYLVYLSAIQLVFRKFMGMWRTAPHKLPKHTHSHTRVPSLPRFTVNHRVPSSPVQSCCIAKVTILSFHCCRGMGEELWSSYFSGIQGRSTGIDWD